jgi:ribosomal protein S12 methylthiotransferase accessory factor
MIYIADKTTIALALHAELERRLGCDQVKWAPIDPSYKRGDLLVEAVDTCRIDRLEYWERIACDKDLGLFCVQVHGGEVVIGPEVQPKRSGCLRCWATRYFGGRETARRFAEMAAASNVEPSKDPWLTPAALSIVGRLSAERIIRAHDHECHTDSKLVWNVYYLDLRTLTGREWQLLPDSSCPRCSRLPFDSAEKAHLTLRSRPKPHSQVDRLRPVRDLSYVHDMYVGRRANIISDVIISWPLKRGAVVTVGVPLDEGRPAEPCSGFCARYSDARTVAVLEGLERYSGVRPRASRPSVRSSVSSLGKVAVDPRCFGLHSKREYQANRNLLTPYCDQLEMDFVWAFSLKQQRAMLVPRQLGFYSLGARDGPFFVIEGSIGCALGSCAEECILHGIFEVVERDAFLLTWYARLSPPQLDPMKCRDPEVRHYFRHLQAEGFEVLTFDITTDFGLPAVWAMARRRDQRMPHAVCLGAAHVRPEQALKKVFRELSGVVCRYTIELADKKTRQRALRLAENPANVRTMMDHALFYCVPESGRYLEFLTETKTYTSLEAMESSSRELWSSDLGEELERTVDRIIAAGSDVLAVDQTAPEQLLGGFCTHKTLVSGAIPMTWGEHLRRLEGLHRLESALENKRGQVPALECEPNPAPHPYP